MTCKDKQLNLQTVTLPRMFARIKRSKKWLKVESIESYPCGENQGHEVVGIVRLSGEERQKLPFQPREGGMKRAFAGSDR
jgi:hypothetical protein